MTNNAETAENNEQQQDEQSRPERPRTRESAYVTAFRNWMDDWKPHAFVTINLPHELDQRSVQHDPQFYLNLWTRCAEADVLGTRTLKHTQFARRIVWMFRREVAPDGLIHYHGPAWFPLGQPWRDETPGRYNLLDRCERLELGLRMASSRTPEPFTPKNGYLPNAADVKVIPWDSTERDHAGYMLKGLWRHVPEWVTDETTYDSGLFILPCLPKREKRKRRTRNGKRTTDTRPLGRLPCDGTGTRPLVPPRPC